MEPDKRQQRDLKRVLKRKGGKRRRAAGKRALADDPESAADDSFDFGRTASAPLNGMDHDATRRNGPPKPEFRELPEPEEEGEVG